MTQPYYTDWILNNFIQVVYDPTNSCSFDYHEMPFNNWPCLRVKRIYKYEMDYHKTNILNYLINGLKHNIYPIAWVDMYYIPGHKYYRNIHQEHGILIYGFDDEKKEFEILYYDKTEKYRGNSITFSGFIEAYNGELPEDQTIYIDFTSINENCCVDYNFYSIQHKLKCYLDSKTYDLDDDKYHAIIGIQSFGLNTFQQLASLIQSDKYAKTADLRHPYFFYEHKKCMMF